MSVSAAPQLAWPVARAQTTQGRRWSRADVLLAVFTLARLCLIPVIVLSLMTKPLVSSAALVVFVIADVYDGVLARRLRCDGVQRRALDSVVDRLAIDSCLIGAYVVGALPVLLLVAFLARDAYCATVCYLMVRNRRVVIKADWVYRGLNLSLAASAIVGSFAPASIGVVIACALLAASLAVAIDLTRCVRNVLRAPAHMRQCVVAATSARHNAFE
jgi:phosphatidylglycerophosphate synthase